LISTQTPLHSAAREGHLSIVEYLINKKANINSKTNLVELNIPIKLPFIMLQ